MTDERAEPRPYRVLERVAELVSRAPRLHLDRGAPLGGEQHDPAGLSTGARTPPERTTRATRRAAPAARRPRPDRRSHHEPARAARCGSWPPRDRWGSRTSARATHGTYDSAAPASHALSADACLTPTASDPRASSPTPHTGRPPERRTADTERRGTCADRSREWPRNRVWRSTRTPTRMELRRGRIGDLRTAQLRSVTPTLGL